MAGGNCLEPRFLQDKKDYQDYTKNLSNHINPKNQGSDFNVRKFSPSRFTCNMP